MTPAAAGLVPALEVRGCSKSYPGVQALSDVSLTVRPGEVRGLVGQNGAGKSTLIKVVAGAVRADTGAVIVEGNTLPCSITTHRAAGIAVIYQDPGVVPALSACENVFLGDLPTRNGLVDSTAMRDQFLALCAELQVQIAPDTPAQNLSLGDRQLVEIMRALRAASTVLILDEPTSALPGHERARLFEVIKRVSGSGVAVVFISHDLDEVLGVCHSVTVLRDGAHVRTDQASAFSRDDLVTCMTGHRVAEVHRARIEHGEPVVRVDHLTNHAGARDVSLEVRAGEILGLAGLLGSGRSEILRAIAGADRVQRGALSIDGRTVRWPTSVRESKRRGIHMVSEDRRELGLVGSETTTMNVALGGFDVQPWYRRVSQKVERRAQHSTLEKVGYPIGRENHPVRNLSGGNQQKVLLARLLALSPRVVLLDEPTAGIDVQASAQILTLIQQMAHEGAAVVVVMSDLKELLDVTHRVQVIRSGAVVGEFASAGTTESDLLHLAFAQPDESRS